MTSPYNIDEEINVGDPDHVAHHEDLAAAVNDLDGRAAEALVAHYSAATLDTGDPDLRTVTIAGVIRSWMNEWGALRGRSPYGGFADSLIRAQTRDGDSTNGNFIEINDNRTGSGNPVLWGVAWGTGAMTQCDVPVGTVFTLDDDEDETDIPDILPAGTLVMRRLP
jgi:hypothetical protein